ncbi:MAG: DUF3300 domain-containing protein [Pseudorhodoplanes sp.]
MPKKQDCVRLRKLPRVAVAALLAFTTTVDPILAQTLAQAPATDAPPSASAPAEAKVFSLADLEYLVGPIALYPDPLIALILPASTFPLQVVQADRWVASHADAVKRNDFSDADKQSWDTSVQALTRFPDVLQMMSEHLDWTQSLGSAFAQQPQDVANAVQSLRAQAQKVGNLNTTPQQVVTTRQEPGASAPVIFIEPAAPDRIYVPVYDPGVVFTSVVATGLIFGTGVLVGSAWNNRWGWNNRGWNTIWVNQPVVVVPGRPGGPPPGAWRPDRPGPRPERPGLRPPGSRPDRPVRPDRPGAGPDRPILRPDRPGVRPDLPVRPDRPGVRPDRPGARPDRPNLRPDGPGARPDRPNIRPDRPGARPDRPAVRPDRPVARPDRPVARPDRPAARPNRPQVRPDRPAARPNPPAARPNRPAARPNPPAARPNRPQARPNPPAQRPQARPGGGNRGGGGGAGAVRNRARNNN